MKHVFSGEKGLNGGSTKRNKQSLGTVMLKGRAGDMYRLSQLKLDNAQGWPNKTKQQQ